jgi:hypothetical protein
MTFLVTFHAKGTYSVAVHDYRFIEFQSEDLYMASGAIQCGVLNYENTRPVLTLHCTVRLAGKGKVIQFQARCGPEGG